MFGTVVGVVVGADIAEPGPVVETTVHDRRVEAGQQNADTLAGTRHP